MDLLFSGYRVSVWGDEEKVLEMDGGDGCFSVFFYVQPQGEHRKGSGQ